MRINYKIILGYIGILIFVLVLAPEIPRLIDEYSTYSYQYFVCNTYGEIGSKNIVTGIYLDYRLFDSLFEAGILFTVAAGILFMGKKDEEIK